MTAASICDNSDRSQLHHLLAQLQATGWTAPIELYPTVGNKTVMATAQSNIGTTVSPSNTDSTGLQTKTEPCKTASLRPLLYLPTSSDPTADTEFWLATALAFESQECTAWTPWDALHAPTSQQKTLFSILTKLQKFRPVLIVQAAEQLKSIIPRLINGTGIPETVDLILTTSGTTTVGGHLVGLRQGDLVASARTTNRFFNAESGAQWVVSLPRDHIAGLQTVVRSFQSGVRPTLLDFRHGFSVPKLLSAVEEALRGSHPVFVSLVPTQLWRCLQAPETEQVIRTLGRCHGILVGGAAVTQSLLDQGRQAGLPLVTTYGMTETAGGCVYNGQPLAGVQIRFLPAEASTSSVSTPDWNPTVPTTQPLIRQICLQVPWRFHSYLDETPDCSEVGTELFVTSDLGFLQSDGHLVVVGRADEVANSGGLKIPLGSVRIAVEAALAQLAQESGEYDRELTENSNTRTPAQTPQVFCTALSDPEWGQRVVVALETTETPEQIGPKLLATMRRRQQKQQCDLPLQWLPKSYFTMPRFPLFTTGKVNRARLNQLIKQEYEAHRHWEP